MITMAKFAEILGLVGVFLVLLAYFLLQLEKLKSSSFTYTFLNFISSCLILLSLCYAWNLPAAIVEIVWALISLYGIYKWLLHRKKRS